MPTKEILRYGIYYALIYVGVLGVIFVGATIATLFFEFRSSHMSIGALIGAAGFTYLRFLEDKLRLPTPREYWSLVAVGSIIVLVVDVTLNALVIQSTQRAGIDRLVLLILIGFPLFKGVLGNMLFFRGGRFAERSLEWIKAKQALRGPPPEPPSNRMTFGGMGPFLVRYFAVYIPLYALTEWVSITRDFTGEWALSLAVMIIAAICAFAYVVRHLGRRPTRSEYWLLVFTSAVFATVFEFVAKLVIDYYRFDGLPDVGTWFLYILVGISLFAAVHAIAYSRPVAWLIRPRPHSTHDAKA
ncbi:ABZJ_00895 family protein [Aureimonas jatrophae]|uniref:Uncharacterized protein n=1 Tax=Aureimonas jatrophae TaxID=1166073 RepID=A0A1H0KAQ2_9HYPH|nr:ABZJ_00895 family protein [Aureimonas jatrophae]MBB3951029.1 uncharacterized membrane protein YjjP (DUF1212 family) [Aureimonas jatrophae]SDO52842.1 hypothetical protein SAMN05192530_107176 [Aureimonas jatrophae]